MVGDTQDELDRQEDRIRTISVSEEASEFTANSMKHAKSPL